MSEPHVLAEVEVADNIHAIPTRPPGAPRAPQQLLAIYDVLARLLAVRAMSFALVLAMIGLSFLAVEEPTTHRLIGAGGFDVLALAGIFILGKSLPGGQ